MKVSTTTTRRINLTRRHAPCPRCGDTCRRHCTGRRRLREIGVTRPTVLDVTYSKHYCERCRKYFNVDMTFLAPSTGRYTHRPRRAAVEMLARQGGTLEAAAALMRREYFVSVPVTTLHDWVAEAP